MPGFQKPDNKTPEITPPSKSKLKEPSKPSFSLLSLDAGLWASLRKKYVSTAKKIANREITINIIG